MGFDPPRYLRGGLVHCAGIGLINKILGQLRFQWKTRVVKGDVDGAIAEIFCSMCVFHSGNLFPSPQAIRRAPRRAASDDPKHQVRKQAIVQERSTMNASVMRMNANAAATRSVACALPARRTAQRGKTQPKQHEQSNSLVLCRLRTRTLGDTRRETREGAGTGGDDRGVDMPMMAWDHDERARERAPDSRERREGARSTAPVVRPSRNAAPPPTHTPAIQGKASVSAFESLTLRAPSFCHLSSSRSLALVCDRIRSPRHQEGHRHER